MRVKFSGKNQQGFFAEVKEEVEAYFQQKNISKNANGEMIFKTVFFLSLMVGLYGLIISNYFTWLPMLGMAIILGMVQAFIGFNVSHDAIHGSYSSSRKVNKILSLSFNLIGANAHVWDVAHNQAHHTFTNIPEHDEDLEVAPGLVRVSPAEEWKPIMRYQQYYAFALYCFASLSWVLRKDYVKFFQKKIGGVDNSKHPKIEYFNLFFFKALYYTLFIVFPLIFIDITWWQFLLGFLAMHIAEGLVLGLIFQLAHVVEGTEFPEPAENGSIDETWAVHQMNTTANFARKSFLAKFLCGGLNFQVEHHLFPNICHVHYPKLSEIVKATADKHGVNYIESITFYDALKSHYKMLKKFGSEASVEILNKEEKFQAA